MKRLYTFALLGACCLSSAAFGREAKLVRYPHYHQGRIVFTNRSSISLRSAGDSSASRADRRENQIPSPSSLTLAPTIDSIFIVTETTCCIRLW